MNSQHIGAAGELLVQYQLLKLGIDSARLTTDAGIDLVIYAHGNRTAHTGQVKANMSRSQLAAMVRSRATGTSHTSAQHRCRPS